MPLTRAEAITILSNATRYELRDHAFGDVEITWTDDKEIVVAEGYYGSGPEQGVSFLTPEGEILPFDYFPDTAHELRKLGKVGGIARNDSTGPDRYAEGVCMPGLTLEGVRKELTGSYDEGE